MPLLEGLAIGQLIGAVAFTLVLLSAVLAVGRRSTLGVALLLMVPALVAKWVEHFQPDLMPAWTFQAAGILFMVFVVTHLLRFILRAPRVDSEVLCAGIATYLMLGVLWMLAYVMVGRLNPQSFTFSGGQAADRSIEGFSAVYFSFITLCTVGFGDIVPTSSMARMLAMTEAIAGMFYVTLLIARLVAIYSTEGAKEKTVAAHSACESRE